MARSGYPTGARVVFTYPCVWPERAGCVGTVVADPGDGVYPFDKPLRGEVIVKLDDDPLTDNTGWWTCTIDTNGVKLLAGG